MSRIVTPERSPLTERVRGPGGGPMARVDQGLRTVLALELAKPSGTDTGTLRHLQRGVRGQPRGEDLAAQRPVGEVGNFPTDLHIAQGLADLLQQGCALRLVDSPEQIAEAVDADTAVLMPTQVNDETGARHDMCAPSALARERGAPTVWDLCHSAGALPVDPVFHASRRRATRPATRASP